MYDSWSPSFFCVGPGTPMVCAPAVLLFMSSMSRRNSSIMVPWVVALSSTLSIFCSHFCTWSVTLSMRWLSCLGMSLTSSLLAKSFIKLRIRISNSLIVMGLSPMVTRRKGVWSSCCWGWNSNENCAC